MTGRPSPVARIFNLVKLESKEISSIYFYAIMKGLILLSIPVGIQALIGFAQTSTTSSSIILLITLIVLSVFIGGVMQVKQMQVTEKIQQKIFVRYAFAISNKIPAIKLSSIDNHYLPELMNRYFDIGTLQKSLAKLLLDFPIAIIQILFGLILLSFYHPVFIAFGSFLILIIWAILYFSGTRGLKASIQESTNKYKVAEWLEEMARTVRSIKFAKSSDFFVEKTDRHITDYLISRTEHYKILEIQFKTLIGFKTLVTAAMLIVGTYLLLEQQINVGQFIAAEIVILTIISSVEKLIRNLDSVYDVLTTVEKIENITDLDIESGGTVELTAAQEGVSVNMLHTTFAFPDNTAPALKNVTFRIDANEKICIQGEEGSGKSTLLRLIAGSYSNFEGSILINDIPIKNYDIPSLRNKIGVIISFQDIFEGSLMDNICMGLKNVDLKEIQQLCEKVGLTEYISSLRNGFDTHLNANGKKLPTHAVKKILLVRALLNKPRLLLLEEPWTGIEQQYKNQIKQMLLTEMKETTILIVTTDEVYARLCDKIIVMQKEGTTTIVNDKK